MRPTRAVIDLQALKHNLARVREAAPDSHVWAVVKANGYGHGQSRVARALDTADGFAVASIDEALTLRDSGIKHPILLLEGFFDQHELDDVVRHDLHVVVHHEDQIEILERAEVHRPIRTWLKLDSGMHRLGFPCAQAPDYWHRLNDCTCVAERPGLMTHLANADVRSDPATQAQFALFVRHADGISADLSIANSAGVLGWPMTHADWVRPGIMLYGISPFAGSAAERERLRPVMTLSTRLIAVKCVAKGGAVGYGGTWRAPEDMPVGVAAVGYGDGYPRHAPSGTPVLVNGKRVPLVGRVSMDMITVDLRTQPNARSGDPVVLWGRGLPAEAVAEQAGTIAYELVCGVTPRVRFEVEGS